jgi:hypothetical protein
VSRTRRNRRTDLETDRRNRGLKKFVIVTFTKYDYNDLSEEDEMGGACSTYGRAKKGIQSFIRKNSR